MSKITDDFDSILDAAETQARDDVELDVFLGDKLVTFAFIQLPGADYAELIAKNPPRTYERPGADGKPEQIIARVDKSIGFNANGVAAGYSVDFIRRVVDGKRLPVTQEQWDRVIARFTGRDLELAGTVIWGINFFTPNERVKAAKKALEAPSETEQSSPES